MLYIIEYLFVCQIPQQAGYYFPVYTVEICPRNELEMKNRSYVNKCNKNNSYMCIPDENLTSLLEFCYPYPAIPVPKGENSMKQTVKRVISY